MHHENGAGANASAQSTSSHRPRGPSAPVLVFAAIEVAALPLLLWYGRGFWFVFDEWDLLSERTGGNLGDLFRPHYQHWFTLPVLEFRFLWELFGLRTYVPYQLV